MASWPPCRTGAMTTASTASWALALCVEIFVCSRICTSLPAGRFKPHRTAGTNRRAAALLFRNLRDVAIDFLDSQDQAPPRLDPRLQGIETRGDHAVLQ